MIRIILFDIDDTIYSKKTGLHKTVIEKAKLFTKNITNFDIQEVELLVNQLNNKYGSILNGLIKKFKIDPEIFIKYVFDVEICNYLVEDVQLKEVLTKIPGQKYAFSNSPREYIEKVLHCLGISDCFDGIYDRRFFDYGSKTEPVIYKKVVDDLNVSPLECILVDDKASNISIAKKLGMQTIWLNENNLLGFDDADFVISNISEIKIISLFNHDHPYSG